MIKQVAHDVPAADGLGPSGLGLALAVAAELHPPVTRAPEVAPPRDPGHGSPTEVGVHGGPHPPPYDCRMIG